MPGFGLRYPDVRFLHVFNQGRFDEGCLDQSAAQCQGQWQNPSLLSGRSTVLRRKRNRTLRHPWIVQRISSNVTECFASLRSVVTKATCLEQRVSVTSLSWWESNAASYRPSRYPVPPEVTQSIIFLSVIAWDTTAVNATKPTTIRKPTWMTWRLSSLDQHGASRLSPSRPNAKLASFNPRCTD